MRYERKYRIETASFDQILSAIRKNPADFKISYADRIVNSIYYDDINFSAYYNLYSISNRIKYRVRWYGDDMINIEKPVLEKKIKQNLLGKKEYFPLNGFDSSIKIPEINKELALNHNQLFPCVLVKYKRTYLESFDGIIRATIDQDLNYYTIFNGKIVTPSIQDDAQILEIKYDEQHTEQASIYLQSIPFQLTSNSKYSSAMKYYL